MIQPGTNILKIGNFNAPWKSKRSRSPSLFSAKTSNNKVLDQSYFPPVVVSHLRDCAMYRLS